MTVAAYDEKTTMVKSNKSSASFKKHEDRELAAKSTFETANVEIQTPQTMILLLASKEDMVVLKAISSLDKYASRLEQNAQALYEANILELILPLLDHPELYIKRFATKLLSELNFIPKVSDELIKLNLIPVLMNILNNNTDYVVKEFSSSIVAELTKEEIALAQLFNSNFQQICTNLTIPDPDIQKNCLQIISNILQDHFNNSLLIQETNFDIKIFINLLMSEYVAVQNLTLDILDTLTLQTKGNTVPKDFQNAGGITMLLSILKDFESKDIHIKCLNVLGNVYNNPTIAQNFLQDGVLQLFSYMKLINDALMRRKVMSVLSKVAKLPLGRKILSESNHLGELESMLLEQSVGLAGAVSDTISGVVQDPEALQQILQFDIVKDLLSVIEDEARGWVDKAPAVNALYQILLREPNACSVLADSGNMDVLASVLAQYNEDVPAFAAVAAANCVTAVANFPKLKKKMVSKPLISSLLHCFEVFELDTTPLKLSACEALCSLLSEQKTRTLLKDLDGFSAVWESIKRPSNNYELLEAAAKFVHLCIVNDADLTNTLMKLDVVNWLLSQKSLRSESPTWEVALKTILNNFLPLKFAMTGRLELTDVTDNEFYVTKVGLSQSQLAKNQFPIMNELIKNKSCPALILYLANFSNTDAVRGSVSPKTSYLSKASIENSSNLSLSVDTRKTLNADPYLQSYLQSLSTILKENGFTPEDMNRSDNVKDGDSIRMKALLIGEFVANQMSGVDCGEVCSSHHLELHINELKVEMMNSMIPIGCLRLGLRLERAFLFKVLADRLGLPACLVRGSYPQRSWIEVALPKVPPMPRPAYPIHLLKPNYVVDLMSNPVTLYPLKSYQADVYCGLV